MTPQMKNVYEALKQNKRKWKKFLFPLQNLECYDQRTINALIKRNLITIHYKDHDGIGKEGYYINEAF